MDSIDFTAFEHTQWERNCQFSAAMVVAYEFIMQFPKEVDLFWRRPQWTFAKGLFLFNRYFSLGFNIGNAAAFMQRDASAKAGTNFFHWQNGGSALQFILTQMILSLRLYAMYERSKKLLAFLVILLTTELTGFIILLELPTPGLVATNNPSTDLFICADGDPPHHRHWIAYVPVMLLITEFILFMLAVFKAWQQYRSNSPSGRILPRLTKESVWFFFGIVLCHLGTVVTWMMNILTLNELWTGYSFSIPAVLANRLLISVREQVDFVSDTMVTENALEFKRTPAALRREVEDTTTFTTNTFELSTVARGDV
ncbi:hypothetical protein FB45DRAFT_1037375 [Roridomyces roridus]|uniref:DUF6533 domain-containing protein n=1 Tax=Roridomyces roridus TaxID=1738132 RepID=A0AAD7B631_9AGAR|nr:hypothetical protein FB45DRAFT_1037375 [Roridomyces roridus]